MLLAISVRRLLGLCGPFRAVADNQASAMNRTCTYLSRGCDRDGSTRRENAAKADASDARRRACPTVSRYPAVMSVSA
jgi:hypothetical protein